MSLILFLLHFLLCLVEVKPETNHVYLPTFNCIACKESGEFHIYTYVYFLSQGTGCGGKWKSLILKIILQLGINCITIEVHYLNPALLIYTSWSTVTIYTIKIKSNMKIIKKKNSFRYLKIHPFRNYTTLLIKIYDSTQQLFYHLCFIVLMLKKYLRKIYNIKSIQFYVPIVITISKLKSCKIEGHIHHPFATDHTTNIPQSSTA